MYPECYLVQIVELPKNGDSSPYAVRVFAKMEYFDFDFKCKFSIKKFLVSHNMNDGEYLIIRVNEHSGGVYVTEAICIYRSKEHGNFMEFKRPGKAWIELVQKVMEDIEIIPIFLEIQTMNKISIPRIGVDESVVKEELREKSSPFCS